MISRPDLHAAGIMELLGGEDASQGYGNPPNTERLDQIDSMLDTAEQQGIQTPDWIVAGRSLVSKLRAGKHSRANL